MELEGRTRTQDQRSITIRGLGAALPAEVRHNDHYAAYLDTSDEWIRARTGIVERRVGGTTAGLAIAAGAAAIDDAGISPSDVRLCVLATTTPDRLIPATSSVVHHGLGLTCGAFDLNAACSGFVYALALAASATADLGPVLVIGSETLTRFTDQADRQTAILMADGAGAAVVGAGGAADGNSWFDLGVDGSLESLLFADHGGYMQMNGREVFRHAVRASASSCNKVLAAAGIAPEEVALFVPHQANRRIIEAVADRLGICEERCAITIDRTGNTSAASIPIALADAAAAGRIRPDDYVLLSGFGAGMTWATALLRW